MCPVLEGPYVARPGRGEVACIADPVAAGVNDSAATFTIEVQIVIQSAPVTLGDAVLGGQAPKATTLRSSARFAQSACRLPATGGPRGR